MLTSFSLRIIEEFRIAIVNCQIKRSLSTHDSKSAIRNPHFDLVRQVRLELTIPCLRGRCLDPIWLLTHVNSWRDWRDLNSRSLHQQCSAFGQLSYSPLSTDV